MVITPKQLSQGATFHARDRDSGNAPARPVAELPVMFDNYPDGHFCNLLLLH